MLLADKNYSHYKLLIPANATEAENYAAEQLQKYFRSVTGALLIIEKENHERTGDVISIGKTQYALKTVGFIPEREYNYDGFLIKAVGGSVFIIGANERGTVYGVNDFLERFLGVKFLAPNVNYIPRAERVEMPDDFCVKGIPEFRYRLYYDGGIFFDKVDPKYAVHRRMFNDFLPDTPKYGYLQDWDKSIPTCHNIFCYIPPEKYKAEHPEYFASYTNSEYKTDDVCYMNGLNDDGTVADEEESVFKIVLASLKKHITENKTAKFFCVCLNDGARKCLCKKCRAIEEKYGAFSAVYILFMNALSQEIEKWCEKEGIKREINLQFYVYSHCFKAPNLFAMSEEEKAKLKLRDNVYIMYCVLGVNYAYALSDERQNVVAVENIRAWSELTKNFLIWDYCSYYDLYSFYFPHLSYMKDNLLFYKNISNYVLSLSDYTMFNSWTSLLRSYVISKLFWDLNLDVKRLAYEFIYFYHGSFAPYLIRFLDNFEERYKEISQKDGIFVNINGNGEGFINKDCFSESFLKENIELLKSAIAEVRKSDICNDDKKSHIERISQALLIPVTMYLKIYCDDLYSEKYDGLFEEYFELLKVCRQNDDLHGQFRSQFREGFCVSYMVNEDRGVLDFKKSVTFRKQCVERVVVRGETVEGVAKITGADLESLKQWIELYNDEVLRFGVKSTNVI